MKKNVVAVLKDFQGLFVLLGVSGAVAVGNIKSVLLLVQDYNVHILIATLIFIYVSDKRKDKNINELRKELNNSNTKIAGDNLRANVKQLAKDLSNAAVIDKQHTIDHIYYLEERRKELGVNSYTQKTLQELISKIKV